MQGLAGGSLNSAAESFSFTIILDSPVPRRKILRTPWRDFYSVGDRKEVGEGEGLQAKPGQNFRCYTGMSLFLCEKL